MNKIPFEYGSIAENEYFIDRIEDRRDLKTFLGGGINVMLISPRRWGKSSLVKAAMEELQQAVMAASSSMYGEEGADGAEEGANKQGPVDGEVVDAEFEVKD